MHLKMKGGEEEEKTAIGAGMVYETFIAQGLPCMSVYLHSSMHAKPAVIEIQAQTPIQAHFIVFREQQVNQPTAIIHCGTQVCFISA